MRACLCTLLLWCTLLVAGCLAPGGGGPPPTPGTSCSPPQLKYLLIDHYGEGRFFYCDPDYYPVARGDEQAEAIEAFPLIVNETDVSTTITARLRLQPPFSPEEKLAIYREYKKLGAIPLGPEENGARSFSIRIGTSGNGQRISGLIRCDGTVLNEKTESAVLTCPICLPGGTMIDTPSGAVQVEDIRAGMIVWSPRLDGTMEAVPVLAAEKTRVPPGHQLVRIRLSDGRELLASPGHPAPDGRRLGTLSPGDRLDGATVTGSDPVPVPGEFTYDILPAGETGCYRANGILLKSTLAGAP